MSMKEKQQVMGYHAIIEHSGVISHMNIAELEVLLRKAAKAANAVVLKASLHDFGNGAGNTGVLLLAESHISVHTWPENNYAAIDIFVCSNKRSVEAAVAALRDADASGIFDCRILERVVRPNNIAQSNINEKSAEGFNQKSSIKQESK